jgi:hypothetical protein
VSRSPSSGICAQGSGTLCVALCLPPRSLEPCLPLCLPDCLLLGVWARCVFWNLVCRFVLSGAFPPCFLLVSQLVSHRVSHCVFHGVVAFQLCFRLCPPLFVLVCFPLLTLEPCLLVSQLASYCASHPGTLSPVVSSTVFPNPAVSPIVSSTRITRTLEPCLPAVSQLSPGIVAIVSVLSPLVCLSSPHCPLSPCCCSIVCKCVPLVSHLCPTCVSPDYFPGSLVPKLFNLLNLEMFFFLAPPLLQRSGQPFLILTWEHGGLMKLLYVIGQESSRYYEATLKVCELSGTRKRILG